MTLWSRTADAGSRAACHACRCFETAPRAIERAIPGLSSLSSSEAAIRADDGWCTRHDRLLRATASCDRFEPSTIPA